jgi:hypothetical protein
VARALGTSRPKLAPLVFPLTEAIIDAVRAGMGIAAIENAQPVAGSELPTSPCVPSGDSRRLLATKLATSRQSPAPQGQLSVIFSTRFALESVTKNVWSSLRAMPHGAVSIEPAPPAMLVTLPAVSIFRMCPSPVSAT